MGPRHSFRGFPLELQASSRPPASRGRNAQDQLSAEPRLPFRGAPRTGPSPTAELTGSVCPTRRAAPAKNSALPRTACSRPGLRHRRRSPSRDRTRSPGEAPAPQGPPPRPGRCAALAPQVPRRVEGPTPAGMGAGRSASRALAWASLPLLGPPAGALCGDTLCSRGKAGRRAPPRAPASSPPGHSRSPRGQAGRTQAPSGFGNRSQANSVNSPVIRSEKRFAPFWSQCFCREKWGDGIYVGEGGCGTSSPAGLGVLRSLCGWGCCGAFLATS